MIVKEFFYQDILSTARWVEGSNDKMLYTEKSTGRTFIGPPLPAHATVVLVEVSIAPDKNGRYEILQVIDYTPSEPA